ncbi:hypothetical protein CMO91_06390 [Candidatus Woesearchaeota archaeon]|nr:hypothetical protein [Candidatus Woesearchaeota archaeon]|tara:strand:- start:38 stop:586 length:549 start_codon:yes stop_codon:yes gene_type:complete
MRPTAIKQGSFSVVRQDPIHWYGLEGHSITLPPLPKIDGVEACFCEQSEGQSLEMFTSYPPTRTTVERTRTGSGVIITYGMDLQKTRSEAWKIRERCGMQLEEPSEKFCKVMAATANTFTPVLQKAARISLHKEQLLHVSIGVEMLALYLIFTQELSHAIAYCRACDSYELNPDVLKFYLDQ